MGVWVNGQTEKIGPYTLLERDYVTLAGVRRYYSVFRRRKFLWWSWNAEMVRFDGWGMGFADAGDRVKRFAEAEGFVAKKSA